MNVHSDARHSPPGADRIQPGVRLDDVGADYWVGQAVLRLRREIAWRRQLGAAMADPVQAALDLVRFDQARTDFFATDPAGAYLSGLIASELPDGGGFNQMSEGLGLSRAHCFVLGLAMAAEADAAMAPLIAACQGDAARAVPMVVLAQALWDDPVEVLDAVDPNGLLARFGLMRVTSGEGLVPAPGLTRWFTGAQAPKDFGLVPVPSVPCGVDPVQARRFSGRPAGLEIVPMLGPAGQDPARHLGGLVAEGAAGMLVGRPDETLVAWLSGSDLVVETVVTSREQASDMAAALTGAMDRSMRVFLHFTERDLVAVLPAERLGPIITLPPLKAESRAVLLSNALGLPVSPPPAEIIGIARDFGLESREIARMVTGLSPVDAREPARLRSACQAECSIDFQDLAEPMKPVFRREDLVLSPDLSAQFGEAMTAIRGAGRVRHDWGDRGAMGVALLFAGPPGTGKTMAAQVAAAEEDLPLFRIDLSQIVNKYIGETEKNLRRVFDTAEKMRCILFFDEAEALFGKRTEVKEANDRFANVETGYLLQRMEQFSGVAILATNRRKDLDDAFARRLRYVIEFPVPAEAERRQIWDRVFPPGADTGEIDCDFLARQFQLTGGHIRSIALNAALQGAARGDARLSMRDVLIATKREMDKLHRKAGQDAFGPWWDEIGELRA